MNHMNTISVTHTNTHIHNTDTFSLSLLTVTRTTNPHLQYREDNISYHSMAISLWLMWLDGCIKYTHRHTHAHKPTHTQQSHTETHKQIHTRSQSVIHGCPVTQSNAIITLLLITEGKMALWIISCLIEETQHTHNLNMRLSVLCIVG